LYHHPRNRFVSGFIGSPKMNFMTVEVVDRRGEGVTVRLPGGGVCNVPVGSNHLDVGKNLVLGIRPEHLVLDDQGPLVGVVQVIERLGGSTALYVQMEETEVIALTDGNTAHQVRDKARFGFASSRAHLFGADGLALPSLQRHPLADIYRKDNRTHTETSNY
ncbi:TOBE domain-containing protein, partial [Halomonas sp. BBD48]|nr:TOBE domain-containing protein [Halomonas sp. BBD48]